MSLIKITLYWIIDNFLLFVVLIALDLSFNQLTKLPSELGNLSALETLKLSNNQLTDVPLVINEFSQLKHLDVSNNRIQFFPPGINSLNELEYLNLSHNLLEDFSIIVNFPGLHEVNVSHNLIKSMDCGADELSSIPWLETVDLRGNPLEDDSRMILQSIVRLKIIVDT